MQYVYIPKGMSSGRNLFANPPINSQWPKLHNFVQKLLKCPKLY